MLIGANMQLEQLDDSTTNMGFIWTDTSEMVIVIVLVIAS